ncbi:translocation/assembly module TamB [Reichenbachiella agarivorans]|uniref:Translocation/assembly module TamB n=1 Tax=Reichenbachiella agarivorans TaxID=2979464 RepID=A0ABY6CMA6_9BACT|nr:translocation/assembly module TamB [Reichenbachiella agarivorans]UXP30869.1 translocation/assembly module TamB [Reichenbachiella agarivorans]
MKIFPHVENNVILHRVARVLVWIPVVILTVLLVSFAFFQIPKIQTRAINSFLESVSLHTSFEITIGHSNLTWYDKMQLKDVRIFEKSTDSTLISISSAHIDLRLFDLLLRKQFNAEILELNEPKVHLIKKSDSSIVNINQFFFEVGSLLRSENVNSKKLESFIDRVEITDGLFSFNDMRQDTLEYGKDYYHFQFGNILTTLSNFNLVEDSIGFEIDRLRSRDPQDLLNINSLFGKFSYTGNRLSVYDFLLKTDKSQIGDSISFEYNHPSDFSYFVDSIRFNGNFKRAKVDFEEIALFNKSASRIKEKITLSGQISGKVGRLRGRNLDIQFGTQSRLRGTANINGLPVLSETFMDLNLKNSVIIPTDLKKYLNQNESIQLQHLGVTQIDAGFLGFASDFVTYGKFYSHAGKIETDLNFKIDDDNRASYTGNLAFSNFDLRAILPDNQGLGKITMQGNVKGSGLEQKNATFTLTAQTDSIQYRGYTYKNIYTEGYFEKEIFNGQLVIQDPNLNFDGSLDIDLHKDVNKIDVTAKLSWAHLKELGFSPQAVTIGSIIDIDMKGLKTDDLRGYISLSNNQIVFKEKELNINSIKFLSTEIGPQRIMHLETDGLTGEIKGEYQNSDLFASLINFGHELAMYLNPDNLEMQKYYKAKSKLPVAPLLANISLNLWDLNKFIQPFYPDFYLSPVVKIDGVFSQDSTSKLNLFTEFDTLRINGYSFAHNEIDLNISKETYDKEVLASIYGASKNQNWGKDYSAENLMIDAIWYQEKMELFFNLDQEKYANSFQINTDITFDSDKINFHLSPSRIKILGVPWYWNEQNLISYNDDEWQFSNLKLFSNHENIIIDGFYSLAPDKQLKIMINDFEFQNLQSLFSSKIEGTLDGSLIIKRRKEENVIESDLIARTVVIEDFLVGNIFGVSRWENNKDRLFVDFHLIRNDQKKIALDGYIYPYEQEQQLDLNAKFEHTHLKIFEPIFKSSIEDLTGYADAILSLKGTIDKPEIYGRANIDQGETTIKYLKTRYALNGEILFNKYKIIPNQLELNDTEKNKAFLSGSITHYGVSNLLFDITGTFKNFKLLNTTSVENTAYYGTAYASGSIHFGGSIDNIYINARAKSNRGTHIAIPLSNSNDYTLEKQEYIEFVDLSDEKVNEIVTSTIKKEVSKIKGVQLLFDIEMTTDAYLELIFDIKAGDIIRGRGNGNIKLQINSDGDFNMFGDFEIDNGGYNFTLYNIINKEFDIQKGSTISWYGNPYEAQLGITAKYRQLTSIAPLLAPYLSEEQSNSTETRRKYYSVVQLSLKGDLLTPQIKFGIDVEDYPNNITIPPGDPLNLESIINAFKLKIATNDQEMNRQVFSLLILRRFSPENNFEVSLETIGSSLSEFVSNQLSYWANQVDENLVIDVNLASLGDDAFNTFQLRLSYTFLDGRLRVTRGGGLPNDQTKNEMSAIIGDWTVEYLLTSDGRLRAKMYSRSDQNNITETGNGIETGFSLQYVRSFDELQKILYDSREENRKKVPENTLPAGQDALKEDEELL